jgi:hypothetical protein
MIKPISDVAYDGGYDMPFLFVLQPLVRTIIPEDIQSMTSHALMVPTNDHKASLDDEIETYR